MQPFLWLFEFFAVRQKILCHPTGKKKKKEKHNIILNSIFRYSEGKQTLSAHAENIPLPNALRCVSEGRSWGPCILNHRFLTYLCQETSGYSRWGKCKETARQDILQCTSLWATAKHFVSLVRKKKPKRILKRESPLQGWFLQLLQAVLHRNIYLLHPMYRVQVLHVTLSVGWGAMVGY